MFTNSFLLFKSTSFFKHDAKIKTKKIRSKFFNMFFLKNILLVLYFDKNYNKKNPFIFKNKKNKCNSLEKI